MIAAHRSIATPLTAPSLIGALAFGVFGLFGCDAASQDGAQDDAVEAGVVPTATTPTTTDTATASSSAVNQGPEAASATSTHAPSIMSSGAGSTAATPTSSLPASASASVSTSGSDTSAAVDSSVATTSTTPGSSTASNDAAGGAPGSPSAGEGGAGGDTSESGEAGVAGLGGAGNSDPSTEPSNETSTEPDAGFVNGRPTPSGVGVCPTEGHVTYVLSRVAQPNADQSDAYEKIDTILTEATAYYNCYTDITKELRASYEPSVATADGNSNGSLRWGSDHGYMNLATAMHEIGHAVGVGSADFGALIKDGIFTGPLATAQLREITGKADDQVHGDTQHFWPYGLNYESEYESESDLINHCLVVLAIRKDMGWQ